MKVSTLFLPIILAKRFKKSQHRPQAVRGSDLPEQSSTVCGPTTSWWPELCNRKQCYKSSSAQAFEVIDNGNFCMKKVT
jgi:hypothetical protein